MRIRLIPGKQKELIFAAKQNMTWRELAKKIGSNESYLSRDLRREKVLLSEEIYEKLCALTDSRFSVYVKEKLPQYWGQSLGSRKSKGSTKPIQIPPHDAKLAEFTGAILGDGHIAAFVREGVYQVNITGDTIKDREYHLHYLRGLGRDLFNLEGKETIARRKKGRHLIYYSVALVKFFNNMGINSGSKIKNQSTIPPWIWESEDFLRSCIRGLIDTDGSIFRMSNQDPQLLRISFTNYNKTLLEDTRKAFIRLQFSPTKIIKNRQFFISRKSDIKKYLKEIGFSNKKHLDRIQMFNSPIV